MYGSVVQLVVWMVSSVVPPSCILDILNSAWKFSSSPCDVLGGPIQDKTIRQWKRWCKVAMRYLCGCSVVRSLFSRCSVVVQSNTEQRTNKC